MPFELPLLLRNRPLTRAMVVLLALAFLLLASGVAATGWMIQRTQKDNERVDHSHQVRVLADSILTDTVNAETGQRGYLLTGDRSYLDVAHQSLLRLSDEIGRLRRLVASDPIQARRVDELRTHINTKVADLDRSLQLHDTGRPKEAVEDVRSGLGRIEMTRIREVVAQFDADEAAQLAGERESARIAANRTLAINFASAVMVVFVGLLSVALVWRYIDALLASRAEIARINLGLEETVAERTHELTDANVELQAARDRAEALLREVNHRVANSLQLVASFVQLQAKGLSDEAARSALDVARARILAVAQIHRRLYTSSDMASVDLADYLTALAAELQQSLAPEPARVRIRLAAERLRVSPDKAVSLGVIVTELVTNAIKYAYPEDQAGEIRIRLAVAGEGHGELTVEDDGRGMGDGPPKGTGLGGRIITAMATTLGAQVEYDAARSRGMAARLKFAIE